MNAGLLMQKYFGVNLYTYLVLQLQRTEIFKDNLKSN